MIIFFLIPLFSGFAHIHLSKKLKFKKIISFFLIFLCISVTIKYHLRFNFDRKFHELENTDISQNINAGSLNKKFNNLKWVTPGTKIKNI